MATKGKPWTQFAPQENTETVPVEGKPWTQFAPQETDVPEDKRNVVGDVALGALVYAPGAMAQGLSEIAAAGFDMAFGTNTAQEVTEFFDGVLEYVKPETTAGQVAAVGSEIGTMFIPFIGWASTAHKAAKAAKAGKALTSTAKSAWGKSAEAYGRSKAGKAMVSDSRLVRTAATTVPAAAYTAGVEFMFSPDGRATLSETFDVGPDALVTNRYDGEEGRENAKRIIGNRFKKAAEGAGLSFALDASLFGIAAAGRGVGQVPGVSTAAAKTAQTIRKVSDKVATQVAESSVGKSAPVRAAGNYAKRYLTPDGGADPLLAKAGRDIADRIDSEERVALGFLEDFHKATDNVLKRGKFWQKTKAGAAQLEKDLVAPVDGSGVKVPDSLDYLGSGNFDVEKTKEFEKRYGVKAREAADEMLNSKFRLEDHVMKMLEDQRVAYKGTPTATFAKEAIEAIKELNKGTDGYLRRLFAAKENPTKFLKSLDFANPQTKELYEQSIKEVQDNIGGIDEYKRFTPEELNQEARRIVNESIHLPAAAIPGANMDNVLRNAIKGFKRKNSRAAGLVAADTPKLSVAEDMLIKRKDILNDTKSLRELMGEVTDPAQRYARTMSDITKTLSAQQFYTQLSRTPELSKTLGRAVTSLLEGGQPSVILLPREVDLQELSRSAAYGQGMGIDGISKKNVTQEQYVNRIKGRLESERKRQSRTADLFAFEADRASKLTPEQFDAEKLLNGAGELRKAVNEAVDQVELDGRYTKLSSEEVVSPTILKDESKNVFGGTYGDLTGSYVTHETAAALKTPLNLSPFSGAAAVMQQLRAFSQKMAIVPSPATQARNMVGGAGMLFMNGNLQRNMDLVETFSLFTRSLDQLDDAGLEHQAKILNASGLLDTSVIYKSLKEYQAFGRQINAGDKVGKVLDGIEDLIPFMSQFEKLYANSDAFFKAVAFRGEYNKLASAFKKGGFETTGSADKRILDELYANGLITRSSLLTKDLDDLELFAAELVKDTMPMYNRVPEAMRVLDRIPILGNFTSFASENVRNSYNILDRGMKEMSFEFSPALRQEIVDERAAKGIAPEATEAALSAFERQIRGNGTQRLTNAITGAVIYPKMLASYSRKMTDTTDQENEGVQDSLQEYATGGDLFYLSNDKNGKLTFIDLNYHNPYGYLTAAATSALRTYDKQGRLGKDEASQIANTSMDFLSKIADPFASETLIFDRLRSVLPREAVVGRGGVTETGAKVWRDSDSLGTKMQKSMAHIVEGVTPRYFLEIAEEKGGRVRPGKVYRSLTGMPDASGLKDFDPIEEGARLLTGLTPMELNLSNTFNFAAREYGAIRSDAKGAFTGMLDDADRTADDMVDAAAQYIQTAIRLQTEMFGKYQAAIKTGASKESILLEMTRGANLSKEEATAIMRGELFIKGVASDMFNDIRERQERKNVTPMAPIPVFRIQQLVQQNLYRPLKSDEGYGAFQDKSTEPRPVPVEGKPWTQFAPAKVTSPSPRPVPVESKPWTQFAPAAAPTGKVNPILLGNEPATQALAEQLGR